MKKEDFERYFNRDFWRAFNNKAFHIKIPKTREEKKELIEKVYFLINSARYAVKIPEVEHIMNKGNGVARTIPIFCIEDYCVYYFCIKELEDVLCFNRTPNTFGGWSLGGKFRKQENDEIECEITDYGRYSFNPKAWSKVFGEFNSLLFAQLDQESYSHILQLDLSNFYDSIRLDMLERWIRGHSGSEKGWIITLLFYLLNHWNRKNTGLHPQTVGLPQDALADCSRILANYYLHRYDNFAEKVCSDIGALYFRYADDQMILLNDLDKIEGLLLLLSRNLDRYGLRINQKKVDIWTADELKTHRFRDIQSIFSEKDDNKKPSLVGKFVNEYLSIKEETLKKSWNKGNPLLNRLLWANLESLPSDQFEKIIDRLTSEQFIILADYEKIKRIYKLNSKRKNPTNFINLLKKIGDRSVHNSYHYEVLAFAILIEDSELKIHFDLRIKSLQCQMETYKIC